MTGAWTKNRKKKMTERRKNRTGKVAGDKAKMRRRRGQREDGERTGRVTGGRARRKDEDRTTRGGRRQRGA